MARALAEETTCVALLCQFLTSSSRHTYKKDSTCLGEVEGTCTIHAQIKVLAEFLLPPGAAQALLSKVSLGIVPHKDPAATLLEHLSNILDCLQACSTMKGIIHVLHSKDYIARVCLNPALLI